MFKTQLVYEFPHGFLFGLNFIHQTGRPWARTVRVPDSRDPDHDPGRADRRHRRLPDWNMLD